VILPVESEADSHFTVSSFKAKVTLVVIPGTSPGTSSVHQKLGSVVVPENQSHLGTLVVDDVKDDVTVSVDATVCLTGQ
jgi:hypothetical protein